jgi:hypothetical protein
VAVISENITLVLPANTQRSLEFLELPVLDGVVCRVAEGSDNEITIHYDQATGHQKSQGVRRSVEEIRLVITDNAHRLGFAETVQRRVARKLAATLPGLIPNLPPQRTSYASIDLSQLREASIDSQEGSRDVEDITQGPASADLPSYVENKVVGDGQRRQERTANTLFNFPQAEMDAGIQIPAANPVPQTLLGLHSTCKQEAAQETAERRPAMPPACTNRVALDTIKDSPRLLKRPSVQGHSNADKTDIDWDEDLRDDETESEAPASKKPKPTSKKAGKSKNTATNRTLKSVPKTGTSQRKPGKGRAKPTVGAAATTKTRIENDGQARPVIHDPNPLTDKALSAGMQVNVGDNQGEQDGSDLKLHGLRRTENLLAQGTSLEKSRPAEGETKIVQEDVAGHSPPMDSRAKADDVAQNDTSFGARLTLALAAKAHLPVTAIERVSRRPFGNTKKFIEAVNVTRNGSPRKNPAKETRHIRPGQHKSAGNAIVLNDQKPVESAARHSFAQSQAARTCRRERSETTVADGGSTEKSEAIEHMHMAHGETVRVKVPEEDVARTTSESAPIHSPSESADPGNMQQDNVELAALAVKQAVKHKISAVPATSKGGRDEENQVQQSHVREESLETESPKRATIASAWPPRQTESWETIQGILGCAELEKRTNASRLPDRFDGSNHRSPTGVSHDEFDGSLLIADEGIQQNTVLVSVGGQGPLNQGVLSPGDRPRVADASDLVCPEPGGHAAAKVRKNALPPDPIALLPSAAASDQVSSDRSEAIGDAESILMPLETSSESLGPGRDSESNEEDAMVSAEEASLVELNARKKAWQSSKVDENGSPRLCAPTKPFTSPPHLTVAATSSERLERIAFTSDELEHSIHSEDNSSSAVTVESEYLQRPLPPGPRQRESRGSIGLAKVLSAKFPQASKAMNTQAFKRQTKSALFQPAVVVENEGIASQPVCNSPHTKPLGQPQIEHPEIHRAPPSASLQDQVSVPSPRVIRLGPRTRAGGSKAGGEDSPTPAPFEVGLAKMLMPPPPLPPRRQGPRDLTADVRRKGQKEGGLRSGDNDATLIGNDDSLEQRRVPTTAAHQQPQTPESTTDSQSSPVRKQMPCGTDSGKEDVESCGLEFRDTQQHILSVLNRAATVCWTYPRFGRWLKNNDCCSSR